ncbi:MAG: copper resistance system multicopper oxidase [Alphaproteobacteria bacterium]|nr:copper resistance system multicopper oxidase [Alphaproteobacteria bacterium]
MITRRNFLSGTALMGGALAASPQMPAWARGPAAPGPLPALSGTDFDLVIDHAPLLVDGRGTRAVAVNGTVPGPLLRWREGDEITLRVTNRLHTDTSIHWHGILVPFQMDGVPGVSFPGIRPGETFTYRFPVRQTGTYWYHSHSGLQEQSGHYGPIVIDPRDGHRDLEHDREYVVVLSDWTFMDPHRLFGLLKKRPDSLNFGKRTVADFFDDAGRNGVRATVSDRLMWGRMRMAPTDIADVTGETYTYLVNGHGPGDNWTALFRPGERIRLRIINASAMTLFNVRIPGLPMTVVQCDGMDVKPVETDEFQMGVAETYDVIVRPETDRAYTLMAESIDRSGYARATLAPRPGMSAPVPPLRRPPLLSMKDMGMAHGDHHTANGAGAMAGMDHGMDHRAMDHDQMDRGQMDHDQMGHSGMSEGDGHAMASADSRVSGPVRHDHPRGIGVTNVAKMPMSRLDEPGLGLEQVPHRALTYAMLRSRERNPDTRLPGRELEIHLTGNMERYMWSFDGIKFSEVVEPIRFDEGERVRLTLVNDTMMSHPIHLHGMFFELENGGGDHKPRKHTVVVKPGEKLSLDVTADAVGDWAFHCHLLYHMHAGMMQIVSVSPRPAAAPPPDDDHSHRHHVMPEER